MAGMATQNDSDESLVARLCQGDHQAFSILVDRHTQRFYMAAYRMIGRSEEAEDIVQEAFLKLWNKPQNWQGGKGAKFTTWFYRIITNLCIDAMRSQKNTAPIDDIDQWQDNTKPQDMTLVEKEQKVQLEKAIQSLPENQRIALNLCFYEELTNKEAADIMGVGVKALESLLMRAKEKLRDILTRDGVLEREGVA